MTIEQQVAIAEALKAAKTPQERSEAVKKALVGGGGASCGCGAGCKCC